MVPSADRRPWSLLALLLLLAVLPLSMSWRLVDTDTLLRLAVGRTIVQQGGVPTHDPLTFSDPARRWSNPEWLGDLLWYGAQRVGGESALIGLRWVLLALALVLLYQLALRSGARVGVLLPLFLLGLLGAAPHLAARNHLHGYWLIALYGLLLERGRRQPKTLWLLLPLGVLWANLHSSFVMGWLLVAVALLEALLAKERPRARALAALLLLHPLLAAISPHGIHAYAQLIDHALGAATYRHWIAEWRPPSAAGVPLFALPLHLIGIVGLLSCLPRVNRRLGALALLVVGLYFAHSSTRFMPLLFALAGPAVAANLQRFFDGREGSARRWGLVSLASTLTLLALCLYGGTLLRQRRPLEQNNVARPMARFVGRNVPAGTHLFNPYNAGPWLQWYGGGKVPLYIDPRNNLGAAALRRYLAVLKDERQFEREVQRLQIDLALVDLADGAMSRLAGHLQQSRHWRLIYVDGFFALYSAEGRPRVAALAALRYDVLRGQLDLDYLRDMPAGGVLASERKRLGREGPALAAAIAGYRLLLSGGAPPSLTAAGGAPWDRGATTRAAALLERALPQLPPSAALMSYLVTAWARLGRVQQAAALVRSARGYFPSDKRLRSLQGALAPTKP